MRILSLVWLLCLDIEDKALNKVTVPQLTRPTMLQNVPSPLLLLIEPSQVCVLAALTNIFCLQEGLEAVGMLNRMRCVVIAGRQN